MGLMQQEIAELCRTNDTPDSSYDPAKFRLKFNEACRRMRVHAMEKFDLLSLRECVWHHELKKAQQEAEQIFLETGERHHTIGGFKITIMG